MKELVVDLISSYEDRISMVADLITTAYQATLGCDDGLVDIYRERAKLRTRLQEILAKNCSMRKKDSHHLLEIVLHSAERNGKEIEEEQRQLGEKLKEYLDAQKELASSVKKRLVELSQGKADIENLEDIPGKFEAICQDKGEQLSASLHNFQLNRDVFWRNQEEINRELEKLVDRGQALRIEDLRQFEAVRARQDREAEKELRREDVERLLVHFRQQRQGNVRRKAVVEK